MNFKKIVISLALLPVLALGTAYARPAAPSSLASVTVDGHGAATIGAFEQTFDIQTASNYSPLAGLVLVSGQSGLFNSLNFSIFNQNITSSVSVGNVAGTFSDFTIPGDLAASTHYILTVTGISKVANAVYSVKADGGFSVITPGATLPVPEPESYAMLLAGLALIGGIAGRRTKKA